MRRVSMLAPGLGLALGLTLAGQSTFAQTRQQPPAAPQLPNEIIVRLSGSSTIGGPMMVETAAGHGQRQRGGSAA